MFTPTVDSAVEFITKGISKLELARENQVAVAQRAEELAKQATTEARIARGEEARAARIIEKLQEIVS